MKYFDVFGWDWVWLARFRWHGDAVSYCHGKGLSEDRIEDVIIQKNECECGLNNG